MYDSSAGDRDGVSRRFDARCPFAHIWGQRQCRRGRALGDAGETLVEILFTIVLVSLIFSALFTSLATAGNASNVQRVSVQADAVLRNFAEATKTAAQMCGTGVAPATTYTVVYPLPTQTLPVGFIPTVTGVGAGTGVGVGSTCPSVTAPQLLTLKVTGPLAFSTTMLIKVITP
jgi:type II secretory pathway pseudopilin PulG